MTAAPRPVWQLLGPAFVAAIAYVDPGNIAANVSAGAQYGFLLVWVIVVANVMAGHVTTFPATVPPRVADTKVTPPGSVSRSTTPGAAAGPRLVVTRT